ncbi:MAG TPA: DNA-3-methyladenine glycosylase [Bacteroidales bacterium]|nr:DNA-3-methyladenine glycosylase [Bacteroidales bacterium]
MEQTPHIVLDSSFYCRDGVTELARLLLGKYLLTFIDHQLTGGMITETEAYQGIHDRASHAFGGKRTQRTRIMFARGGVAYVFLCYGMHSLFNIVTNEEEVPDAILIRGIKISHGHERVSSRMQRRIPAESLISGPGLVSRALGITPGLTGWPLVKNLNDDGIWIEDRGIAVPTHQVQRTARIGVGYAGEDALLPYRYLWCPEK